MTLPKWFTRKAEEKGEKIYFGISDEIPEMGKKMYCMRIDSMQIEDLDLGPVFVELSVLQKLEENLYFAKALSGDIYVVRIV